MLNGRTLIQESRAPIVQIEVEMKDYWIIPCNPKHFDVITRFETDSTVIWRNSFSIRKGDVAYIYLSAPFSEIRYRCNVISEEVDDETLQANAYAIPVKTSNNYFSKRVKYIVLELDRTFPQGKYTLEELKKHGLGQVQIQARADRRLRDYLLATEDQL